MRPKTNRLLMLLVGVVISGCASQTDRSSSGGGVQAQTERERVGGSSNAVTQAELERRAAAKAAVEAPAPQAAPAPPPAPAYEPERESVQYVDRPLAESPPSKAAVVAVAAKNEPTPDFPVTKYELPEEQAAAEEVEDLGTQDDESVSAEQASAAAAGSSVGETTAYADADEEEVEDLGTQDDESVSAEQASAAAVGSSVGETTAYADADEEEVEDLGMQDDESVSAEQEAADAADSSVGEPTVYADADEEEVEDLGTQDDESVSAEQDAAAAAGSSVGEPTAYADADEEEVEDLGTQPDDSGTASFAEEKRAAADNVVGEPKIYPDEPAPKATPAAPQKPAPAVPKSITVNFETEPLFNFDKSAIRADQRAKLDEFVSGLGGTRYDSIAVVGHADHIGQDAYNQKLSERRAAAVKAYLVKKGVPSDKIRNEGRGESESVTGDACNKARGKALISCLQPDRRVDVSVSGTKQAN